MVAPPPPQRPDYSDLEVVTKPATPALAQSYGPEVHNSRNDPEIIWAEHDPTALPYAYAWDTKDEGGSTPDASHAVDPPQPRTVCGMRRKLFWILVSVTGFVLAAGSIGGGVGGYFATRGSRGSHAESQSPFVNLSISALHWVDERGVGQYRVYHQIPGQSQIFESARNTGDKSWTVSPITDLDMGVREGTPLASAAGYPHTNTSNDLVRNVYFLSPSRNLIERQSPYKTQDGIWGNDNLSGQYTPSDASSLFSYWYQDFEARFQILAVFFQDFGANSLTVAKYVENVTQGEPWQTARQSMDIQDGSSIVAAPAGDRRDLRLYVGGGDGKLKQYRYDIEENALGSPTGTDLDFAPNTPICVTTEDHRASFTKETFPECAKSESGAFLTHLILLASPDRKNLTLTSWNCSGGFTSQQGRIEGLLKPGRTYLDLGSAAASNMTFGDDKVYVLFDEGEGPDIEEWAVPAGQTDGGGGSRDWKMIGTVPTKDTG